VTAELELHLSGTYRLVLRRLKQELRSGRCEGTDQP